MKRIVSSRSFRANLAVLLSSTLILVSCSNEMTMPRFEKLSSFQGRVAKVQQIPYETDYRLHSASAPDFRVTIIRADGSTLVIKRIHTQIGGEDALKKLVSVQSCTLPEDVVRC